MSQARKVRDQLLRVLVFSWRMNPINRICAVCGKPAEKGPHHIIPRSVRPDLVCCIENFLALCWTCHSSIDQHRALAYAAGLLGHSWEKFEEINERRRNCLARLKITWGKL